MVWIPEDGTGLANANCYIDADGVRAYALARGISLPAIPVITPAVGGTPAVYGPDPIAPWMVLAMDYLSMQNFDYSAATMTQALAWPRAWCYDTPAVDWLLPVQLQYAQAQLVIEQFNGIELFASKPGFNQGGGFITREKIDVIETSYSERVIPGVADMPAVLAWLRPMLVSGGGLRTVRV